MNSFDKYCNKLCRPGSFFNDRFIPMFCCVALIFTVFTIILVLHTAQAAEDTSIVAIRNCSQYWVGAVMWNEDHTDYTDVPDFELKEPGVKIIKLKNGDYAITVFRQRQAHQWQGRVLIMPAKIVDFIEITINSDRKLEFGCDGEYR